MSNAAAAPANENAHTETTMTEEEKRAAIRERIEAGEADLERRQDRTLTDQLTEAKDAAVDFTRKHPLAVVAGGFVAGIVISAFFKNSPTRRLGRRGAAIAAIAADTAMEYGHQAYGMARGAGRTGLEAIDDFGDRAGDEARSLHRAASYRTAGALDRTKIARRNAIKGSRRSLTRAKGMMSR